MWPGSSPSAVVNGAAGMIIAALLVAALYVGRDLLMPLALAGLLGFVLAPLVHRFLGTDHLRRIHVIHDGLYPGF